MTAVCRGNPGAKAAWNPMPASVNRLSEALGIAVRELLLCLRSSLRALLVITAPIAVRYPKGIKDRSYTRG